MNDCDCTRSPLAQPGRPEALLRALMRAQKRAAAIERDSHNERYAYTSAESMLEYCRGILLKHGLLAEVRSSKIEATDGGMHKVVRVFELHYLRKGGGSRRYTVETLLGGQATAEHATASALTTSLAYWLRDLLMLPRREPEEDLNAPERTARASRPPSNPPQREGHTVPTVEQRVERQHRAASNTGGRPNGNARANPRRSNGGMRDLRVEAAAFTAGQRVPIPRGQEPCPVCHGITKNLCRGSPCQGKGHVSVNSRVAAAPG